MVYLFVYLPISAEGAGRQLEAVVGEASLSDGPAEVSDNEAAGIPAENFDAVEAAEPSPQPQDPEPVDHVVPDAEGQLIDFDDDDDVDDVVLDGAPAYHGVQHEPPAADDEFDLPPPPPPLDLDDQ